MESLALLVAVLLVVLILSAVIGMLLSWRAGSMVACVVGALFGLPGAVIGSMVLINVRSIGGFLFGCFGLLGFIAPLYRMYRLPKADTGE